LQTHREIGSRLGGARREGAYLIALGAGEELCAVVEIGNVVGIQVRRIPAEVSRAFGEERPIVGNELLRVAEVDIGDGVLDLAEIRIQREHGCQVRLWLITNVSATCDQRSLDRAGAIGNIPADENVGKK